MTDFTEPRFDHPPRPMAQRVGAILWPSFFAAGVCTMVFFAFIDPIELRDMTFPDWPVTREMGYTLGFFMFSALGVEGALVQMISHGFVSGAMFFAIGVMYDRAHSRQIADYGGVVNSMPKFAAFFMLFAMANAGLPATSGFVGEFMVILAAVDYNFWVAFAAATTMIVGAAYTLWMYKRVVFGAVANHHVAELTDINGREFLIFVLFAAGALGMGLYPQPFTEVMHSSVNELLRHVALSKIQ